MNRPNVRAYTCTVEGCERPGYARGVCSLHYDRIRRTGTTEAPPARTRNTGPCSVPGCELPYSCKGLCRLHWDRQYRNGTVADPEPRYGPANPAWKGDAASYKAVHQRMYRQPRPGACERCSATEGRFEWALRPDVAEGRLLRSPEGWAYSTDPADYLNLCKSCHNQQDLGGRSRKEVI